MALIECPDCKKQISDASSQCIHCGRPTSDLKRSATTSGKKEPTVAAAKSPGLSKPKRIIIGGIALVAAVFAGLMYLASPNRLSMIIGLPALVILFHAIRGERS